MDESKMLSEKFELPSSISELPPINEGELRPQYRQVNCQKSIEKDAFAGGQQSFRFNVSGSTWWDPTKTYFSFRMTLQNNAGLPLTDDDGFAPTMGLLANLYQSIELRMGGKVVQRISQFVPQCDALLHRSTRSGYWLDSFGGSTNLWNSEYTARQAIALQVPGSDRTNRFEFCWKPPLPIFHTCDKYLPSGDYEIVLNPQPESQFRRLCFEAGTTIPAGSDNNLTILRVHLNVATVEGPRMDNGKYALSLTHIECQSNQLLSQGLSQTNFSVSSATKALVVAYQDRRLNNGVMTSSKFCISEDVDPQATTPNPDNRIGALKLTRLYIQYDGLQRPSPDADPSITQGLNNSPGFFQLTERYYDTVAETGMMYDEAGPESIQDWIRRGPYYYFNWNRDSRSGATRVVVNQEFSSKASVDNGNVLLFAISETSAEITVRNGEISDVVQVER